MSSTVFGVDLVNLNLDASDKVSAITALAQLVVDSGRGSNLDAIVADVLERDAMGTPQVEGVAIPHARTSGVSVSSVAIGRVEGVVFDPDEDPATTIFMILVPDSASDEHIVILQTIARKLMDPDFTEVLRSATSAEQLVAALSQGDNS